MTKLLRSTKFKTASMVASIHWPIGLENNDVEEEEEEDKGAPCRPPATVLLSFLIGKKEGMVVADG
jgi:hypothetical protein